MPPAKGQMQKYKSAAELQRKIDEYFDILKAEREEKKDVFINSKTGIPVYFQRPAYYASLLLHLGMVYSTAEPYENGDYDTETECYSEVLNRARIRIEQDLAEGAMRGIYSPKVTESALQRHHEFATKYEVKTDAKQHGTIDISAEIAELTKDKTEQE